LDWFLTAVGPGGWGALPWGGGGPPGRPFAAPVPDELAGGGAGAGAWSAAGPRGAGAVAALERALAAGAAALLEREDPEAACARLEAGLLQARRARAAALHAGENQDVPGCLAYLMDSALTPVRSWTRCQPCLGLAPASAAVPEQEPPAPFHAESPVTDARRAGGGSSCGTATRARRVRLHGCLHIRHAGQSARRTRAARGRPQALRAGVHPYHHRCLGLYGCLASAARVACRRGGGGARAARWAACARLLLAGTAESLLSAGAAAPGAWSWRDGRRGELLALDQPWQASRRSWAVPADQPRLIWHPADCCWHALRHVRSRPVRGLIADVHARMPSALRLHSACRAPRARRRARLHGAGRAALGGGGRSAV